MKKLSEQQEQYKIHSIRMSDKIWQDFSALKPRDKSWDLFLKELLETINYFKKL